MRARVAIEKIVICKDALDARLKPKVAVVAHTEATPPPPPPSPTSSPSLARSSARRHARCGNVRARAAGGGGNEAPSARRARARGKEKVGSAWRRLDLLRTARPLQHVANHLRASSSHSQQQRSAKKVKKRLPQNARARRISVGDAVE